jgi:hypothetical protein
MKSLSQAEKVEARKVIIHLFALAQRMQPEKRQVEINEYFF